MEYSAKGTDMPYIHARRRPLCLFEPREDVKRLNDEAKLPYARVVEALDLTHSELCQARAALVSACARDASPALTIGRGKRQIFGAFSL